MRRIVSVLILVVAGLALAQDKPPGGAPGGTPPTALPPSPASTDECGAVPPETATNPLDVTWCWSQAEVDALPPDPDAKKSVAPPSCKPPQPKPSGSAAPPKPADPSGKGTSFNP